MNSRLQSKLSDIGEFGFISRIAAAAASGAGVVTSIGDDAAVTCLTPGMQLLTSTDMLLEDVHFRRDWHDPYRLGRKSLAVNISDIAAMGAIPRWALLSLAIPTGLPLDFLDEFVRGFLAKANEHGVTLIGGDTCASRGGLAISVTIMGEQLPERILRRSGARPDDEIWVTGTIGDAALGLKLLEQQLALPEKEAWSARESAMISRLLNPTPRVAAGIAMAEAGLASTMIDISDGLLADFGHIAELSDVGGIIRVADLPRSEHFLHISGNLEIDADQLALSGGEDYELLFTAPPEQHEKIINFMKISGIRVTPVGIVTSSKELLAQQADGSRNLISSQGFNHFR